jgi:hypothetical protein
MRFGRTGVGNEVDSKGVGAQYSADFDGFGDERYLTWCIFNRFS